MKKRCFTIVLICLMLVNVFSIALTVSAENHDFNTETKVNIFYVEAEHRPYEYFYGLQDEDGNVIAEAKYYLIEDLGNSGFYLAREPADSDHSDVEYDYYYCILNKKGECIFKFNTKGGYADFYGMLNGVPAVRYSLATRPSREGLFSVFGEEIIPCAYTRIYGFSEHPERLKLDGLIPVQLEPVGDQLVGSIAYINLEQDIVFTLPEKYYGAMPFTEGFAAVEEWGTESLNYTEGLLIKNPISFVDTNGNITPTNYYRENIAAALGAGPDFELPYFYNGYAAVLQMIFAEGATDVGSNHENYTRGWGVIDKDFYEIIPCIYSYMSNYSEGYVFAEDRENWWQYDAQENWCGYLNEYGERAITLSVSEGTSWLSAGLFNNGVAEITEYYGGLREPYVYYIEKPAKTLQNISVPTIAEKMYGDAPFSVAATPDADSGLTEISYASSNPAVAEISADGTATIKAAGTTTITVSQAGNDIYAPFTKTQLLTVKKMPVTVMATASSKRVGIADPAELAYTYTGTLVGTDTFMGRLSRQSGEAVGTYDILLGTLTLGSNYEIAYVPAVFEILDKTQQNITVPTIAEKTYGDAPFSVAATPDETANLTEFTYESDNTDVAEVAADGTVTVKKAGEANISVKQAGNDEYAAYVNSQKLIVNKKPVTVESIDFDTKTAVLAGVLLSDSEVALDYTKLNIAVNGEASETEYNVTAENFVLTGENSVNYTVSNECVIGTVLKANVAIVNVHVENGIVTGDGMYYIGDTVTLSVTPNRGYAFKQWKQGENVVSTNATYTFVATANIDLVANCTKVSSGGSTANTVRGKVKFNTNGGDALEDMTILRDSTASNLPTPSKEGYIFAGWYKDEALTQPVSADEKLAGIATLYAAWNEVIDPTLNNGVNGAKDEIVLVIDKKEVSVWGEHKLNDVAPKLVNNRTMLPIRMVAEALGAEVIWTEDAPNQVIIKNGETTITLEIGASVATVNGEEFELDSPSFLENDRTYMPLRFISKALGAQVEWDEVTQKVTIKK